MRFYLDSIDLNWDPNDLPVRNILPPLSTGLPGGIDPNAISDPKLRAEYEAERHLQQSSLRDWLKRYPITAERYIIELYSLPPYNNEELEKLLNRYLKDQTTRDRIMTAVRTNIEKAEKEKNK